MLEKRQRARGGETEDQVCDDQDNEEGEVGPSGAGKAKVALMLSRLICCCLLPGIVGCASAARKDVETVCFAEERAGASEIAEPALRADRTARWLESHVRTEGIRQALKVIATADPQSKAHLMRQLIKEHGYDGPCPAVNRHTSSHSKPSF